MLNIKKDEIILVSSGEYSDYSIKGLFIALEDIDVSELRNNYINLYPEQTGKYSFKDKIFIDYVLRLNIIKPILFKEWYLESYSNIAEMNVTEGPMLFT